MEAPLIDKIKEALADIPNTQVIVEGFRNAWENEVRDAYHAGDEKWCDDHRCINVDEYLKNHFNIDV